MSAAFAPVLKRRRPQTEEMAEVTVENRREVALWCGGQALGRGVGLYVKQDYVVAHIGDYVVRGVDGTFYPADADNVAAGYEDLA